MRRVFVVLSAIGLMQAAVGCRHVGGPCDCGIQPGEAALYAPFNGYRPVTPPISGTTPVGTPVENIPAPKEGTQR